MAGMKPQLVRISGQQKFTRLLAGSPSTAGMKAGYVVLQPGEAVGEHKTDAREEAIIILEGQAAVYCDKEFLFKVEAESLVYIPSETNHDVRNESSRTLRYVYVVTPVALALPPHAA